MGDSVSYACSALTVLAALIKALGMRGTRPEAGQWFVLAALVTIGASMALNATPTQEALTVIQPFPHTTRLLGHLLAMASFFSLVAILGLTTLPRDVAIRRIRWGTALLASCMAIMTGLVMAHPNPFGDLSVYQGRMLLVYQLIFYGYLAFVIFRFGWLIRHYLRPPAPIHMRVGVSLDLAGAAVGLVWFAWKAFNITATALGDRLVDNPAPLSRILTVTGVALMATGLSMPTVGGWICRLHTRWRLRRALTAITPLWTELTRLVPTAVYPSGLDTDTSHDLESQLYQRVVAIRDAMLRLHTYVDPQLGRWVDEVHHGRLAEQQSEVLLEAAALATALDAYAAGQRHPLDPTRTANASSTTARIRPTDLLAEARTLIRLHTAMRTNKFVQQLRHRTSQNPHPTPWPHPHAS